MRIPLMAAALGVFLILLLAVTSSGIQIKLKVTDKGAEQSYSERLCAGIVPVTKHKGD